MKTAVLNAFDSTFEIQGHDGPIVGKPYLQGRITLDDLISREINKAYGDLKHGATARSLITSF